jgi:hypothetical protein
VTDLVDFYQTQVTLLWKWRGGPIGLLKRLAITLVMVSSVPADAAEMVRRASNGEGLLSNNGVSISNLVNGDATRSYLTSAGLTAGAKGLGDSRSFYPFFFSPSGIPPLAHFVTWGAHYGADPVGAREARWCRPPARPGMAVRVQASSEERPPP